MRLQAASRITQQAVLLSSPSRGFAPPGVTLAHPRHACRLHPPGLTRRPSPSRLRVCFLPAQVRRKRGACGQSAGPADWPHCTRAGTGAAPASRRPVPTTKRPPPPHPSRGSVPGRPRCRCVQDPAPVALLRAAGEHGGRQDSPDSRRHPHHPCRRRRHWRYAGRQGTVLLLLRRSVRRVWAFMRASGTCRETARLTRVARAALPPLGPRQAAVAGPGPGADNLPLCRGRWSPQRRPRKSWMTCLTSCPRQTWPGCRFLQSRTHRRWQRSSCPTNEMAWRGCCSESGAAPNCPLSGRSGPSRGKRPTSTALLAPHSPWHLPLFSAGSWLTM